LTAPRKSQEAPPPWITRSDLDLIGLTGYYTMLAMVLNVARQPLPNGVPPPLPVLN